MKLKSHKEKKDVILSEAKDLRDSSAYGLRMTAIFVLFGFFVLTFFSGCGESTYPEGKIENAIKEICRQEYKIEEVEVKFSGKTISVFLPLKKLFTTDVRREILSGQINNLESLFEPDPGALEQLENVLFTISRVLLSSSKPIDFYIVQATDVETTGLQLILTGYMNDVKRVRLWDIPRSEYRKRILHELKFNRAVLWEKPVRGLLRDVSRLKMDELAKQYFSVPVSSGTVSPLFYHFLTTLNEKENLKIKIETVKSRTYQSSQILVYAKFTETYNPKPGVAPSEYSYPSGTTLEYLFVVEPFEKQFKIVQVVPLRYVDAAGHLSQIPLPESFNLDQNLESWPERFTVENLTVGEFLARQLNRRVQALLLSDERIHHTIRHAQINFAYRDSSSKPTPGVDSQPHFSLYFDFLTKAMKDEKRSIKDIISDEDILYLFDMILREFADLARSYRFEDFKYLELVWQSDIVSASIRLDPNRLDLFRVKKLNIVDLLESPLGPPRF